jgi:pyruvate kinase
LYLQDIPNFPFSLVLSLLLLLLLLQVGKPVLITRVVDTMAVSPRPTRAEATDVANAVLDGVDGILLGQETLRGFFPIESVQTLVSIARQAEKVCSAGMLRLAQQRQISISIKNLLQLLCCLCNPQSKHQVQSHSKSNMYVAVRARRIPHILHLLNLLHGGCI